jgi:hypothetical protein
MRKNQIFFSQKPDPTTLQEQDDFTIILHEDGSITGDLCKNTTNLLEYLREIAGIEHDAVIDFCG